MSSDHLKIINILYIFFVEGTTFNYLTYYFDEYVNFELFLKTSYFIIIFLSACKYIFSYFLIEKM